MKNSEIIVFPSIEKLSWHLHELLVLKSLTIPEGKYLSLALSGGSTPRKVFNHISSFKEPALNWKKVRLFWVDERCVSPEDDESNFKMTRQSLLDNINIPDKNIFRIFGENDPGKEATRYSKILSNNLPSENGIIKFDLVLLGLGEDGHTASIFPDNITLFKSRRNCEAVLHPQTGQQRITITGPVINNANTVIFVVTGPGKAKIISKLTNTINPTDLPASHIKPTSGNLLWLIDKEAANLSKRLFN